MTEAPTVALPLDRLRRLLLTGNTPFILGIACFSSWKDSSASADVFSQRLAAWRRFVGHLQMQMSTEWHVPLDNHNSSDVIASLQRVPIARNNSKDTFRTVQVFRSWRSLGSTLLDFGINERNSLARLGRNCDGILLVVDGDSWDASRWIHGLRRESLPWLGYWQVDPTQVSANETTVANDRSYSSTMTPQAA